MRIRNTAIVFSLWACALAAAPAQAKALLEIKDAAVHAPPQQPPTQEQVQQAILEALDSKGWQGRVERPGLIRGEITVRGTHHAVVDIPFSASRYSIRYVSSQGLGYNPASKTIKHNYNSWVQKLQRRIDQHTAAPARHGWSPRQISWPWRSSRS
jgi:hypothetical protein